MLNTSQKSILFTGTSICNQLSNNMSNTTTSFTHNYKKLVLQTLSEQNSILIITLNHYYYQVSKNFFCYYCYFYHHYQYHYYNYISIHHHYFFFYLSFLSRTFINHRTVGEGGGNFFISSRLFPPASQTLGHQPGDYCRELTSAHSQQPDSSGSR